MEQTFKLVAPNARLTERYGGKLEEMLSDGTAEALVKLLAIPVRPRIAVNPNRFASQIASRRSRMSATVAFKRRGNAELRKCPPRLLNKTTTTAGSRVPNSQPATLAGLPTEIHRLIFCHLVREEEVLNLGLVNRHLCHVAREQLVASFFSLLAPWACQKIVYVGENTEPNDYPPGLFSDAELEALGRQEFDVYDEDDGYYISIMTVSNLHHFTMPEVSNIEGRRNLKFETVELGNLFSQVPASEDAALTYLGPTKFPSYSQYFPQDQPWILRNLTTKQFVRAEAIALQRRFIHGPEIDFLGFGHVILLRICWSSQPVPEVYPENIVRGKWAGH
ncbi:F-box domain containing protein [Metarhizium guizhouense ARSEF 977]|uniref:F-box domain containing protein n=1 Tax=Metarhizium guizhouense (strain ARSEF 977) TaxID=1276136 RepID=A0A0B4GTI4_METGA|nr:F-box domain containing protein [Metarhizium guizhouense ARSEF 977]